MSCETETEVRDRPLFVVGSEFFQWAAKSLWSFTIIQPLRTLYFYGPRINGHGFWGGLSPEDSCAHLTGVSATLWANQQIACKDLLERKFHSFSVAVFFFFYVWAFYITIKSLIFKLFYLDPLINEIRKMRVS